MDWAREIKSFRLAMGITQGDLSRESKVSLPLVKRIEAGRIKPSLGMLSSILPVLGKEITTTISAIDWQEFANLGLPLPYEKLPSFKPTKKLLIQRMRSASLYLRLEREASRNLRKVEAFESLVLAVKENYPKLFQTEFAKSILICSFLPTQPRGKHIKLKRVSETILASYLKN